MASDLAISFKEKECGALFFSRSAKLTGLPLEKAECRKWERESLTNLLVFGAFSSKLCHSSLFEVESYIPDLNWVTASV